MYRKQHYRPANTGSAKATEIIAIVHLTVHFNDVTVEEDLVHREVGITRPGQQQMIVVTVVHVIKSSR
jgi:hypothetical protein